MTPPLMMGESCTIIVSACEVMAASSFLLFCKLPRAQASELFRLFGFIEMVDVTLLGVKLIFLKCLRFYINLSHNTCYHLHRCSKKGCYLNTSFLPSPRCRSGS